MSFIFVRQLDSIYYRRAYFWEILFSGLPDFSPDDQGKIAAVHNILDHFRLGLMSYPYRDRGENGTTCAVHAPKDVPMHRVLDYLRPSDPKDLADSKDALIFTGHYSIMDFLTDYFGLDDTGDNHSPLPYSKLVKKYSEIFLYGILPPRGNGEFADLLLRASRKVLANLDLFTDHALYFEFSPHRNAVETFRLENDNTKTPVDLGSIYF